MVNVISYGLLGFQVIQLEYNLLVLRDNYLFWREIQNNIHQVIQGQICNIEMFLVEGEGFCFQIWDSRSCIFCVKFFIETLSILI